MSTNVLTVTDNVDVTKLFNNIDGLLVVHFLDEKVRECIDINEVLDELARLNPSVKFAKIAVDKYKNVAAQSNVTRVPTCVFLQKGQELGRVEGADVPQLTSKVKALAAKIGSNDIPTNDSSANIEDRLKALTNKATVMVFMKGSPEAPRCGFSRTLVGILDDINAKYETFDILMDEEVRQSLKAYSNWPTYPQIYVNGNLIGGLDIIKELKETGELEEALKG